MIERFCRHIGNGNMVIEWGEVAWLDNDLILTTDINKRRVFRNRSEAETTLRAVEELVRHVA